ncbi:hypothetical protein C8R42DRAFT_690338 [Lentinula raphanica]|nr:hypothetical protein C8R42DRAFT_690338 [Lentinula raphanica]
MGQQASYIRGSTQTRRSSFPAFMIILSLRTSTALILLKQAKDDHRGFAICEKNGLQSLEVIGILLFERFIPDFRDSTVSSWFLS